jgi:hypothetical protein
MQAEHSTRLASFPVSAISSALCVSGLYGTDNLSDETMPLFPKP